MILKRKNKIIFFTGSRADFTTIKLVIEKIKKINKFKILIYFSGSHYTKSLGNTFRTYFKSYKNFEIRKISFFKKTKNFDTKKIFKLGKKKLLAQLLIDKPDLIYILGDRYEAMIAAISAYELGIRIIHSGGGEITLGSKDNYYRNMITKVASIHLATSKKGFLRLKKIVSPTKVFFTGSPIIEYINKLKKKNIKHNFFNGNKFVLMSFHPSTNSPENISKLMLLSIKTLLKLNYKILITYPNQDPGYTKILNIIDRHKKNKNIIAKTNLADNYFDILRASEFLIGNSSSGIIEAPYFKKKVINIGLRQKGRPIDKTVINVRSNLNKFELDLIKAIKKRISKFSSSFYGSGNTIQKQVKVITGLLKNN